MEISGFFSIIIVMVFDNIYNTICDECTMIKTKQTKIIFCFAFILLRDICLTYKLKILHGVNPLSYFSFQPVLHDWCNKGSGMCYPVCGKVHIKEPLLSIDKSSLCGGSGFPFSLSEWSLTICLTPYNRR